jgi:UDP-N-acetyl-D-mannosaminuronic acid transferase (WecB/TagA/CpsF family)
MENQNNHRKIPVLGIEVDSVSVPRAVEISQNYLSNDYFNFVLLAGARLAMESQESEEASRFVQAADLILPGDHNIEKAAEQEMNGSFQESYLDSLLTILAEQNGHLCVLCESEEQAFDAVEHLGQDYPGLNIDQVIYDQTGEEALETLVNTINGFFPELVLPLVSIDKQRILLLNHRDMLSTRLYVSSESLVDDIFQEEKTEKDSLIIVKWLMKHFHLGQEAVNSDFWQKFRMEQEDRNNKGNGNQ